MITFDTPTLEDIPQLIRLWGHAFGEDETQYAKIFFDNWDMIAAASVARDGNNIVGMGFLLNCGILFNNTYEKALFLMGGATLKEYCGQGINSRVLSNLIEMVQNLNIKYMLVNCNDKSKSIFGKKGFLPDILSRLSLIKYDKTAPIKITRCSFDDFAQMRSAFEKANTPCVCWPENVLRYFYNDTVASGDVLWNEDYKLYAVVNIEHSRICIKETNCQNDNMQPFCNSIMNYYKINEIQVYSQIKQEFECAKATQLVYRAHSYSNAPEPPPQNLYIGFFPE